MSNLQGDLAWAQHWYDLLMVRPSPKMVRAAWREVCQTLDPYLRGLENWKTGEAPLGRKALALETESVGEEGASEAVEWEERGEELGLELGAEEWEEGEESSSLWLGKDRLMADRYKKRLIDYKKRPLDSASEDEGVPAWEDDGG